MKKFLLKLLFLAETLIGVYFFVTGLFNPVPIMGANFVMIFLGIIMVFDGLERLDGKEHGPY